MPNPLQTGTFLDDLPDQYQPPSLPSWEQVAPQFQQAFPDLNLEEMQRQYQQSRATALFRAGGPIFEQANESATGGVSGYLARRSVPFVSQGLRNVETTDYGQARRRVEESQASPEDYRTVSQYEQRAYDEAHQGPVGDVLSTVAGLPAFAGEIAATGPVYRGANIATQQGIGALGRLGAPSLLTRGAARRGAGMAVGAAAQTAVNLPALGENVAQRMNPIGESKREFLEALPAGAMDAFIENFSERLGGTRAFRAVSQTVGHAASGLSQSAINRLGLQSATEAMRQGVARRFNRMLRSVPVGVNRISRETAWDGLIGEYMEERAGELMRGTILPSLGDQRAGFGATGELATAGSELARGNLPGARQAIGGFLYQSMVEGLAFSVYGRGMAAGERFRRAGSLPARGTPEFSLERDILSAALGNAETPQDLQEIQAQLRPLMDYFEVAPIQAQEQQPPQGPAPGTDVLPEEYGPIRPPPPEYGPLRPPTAGMPRPAPSSGQGAFPEIYGPALPFVTQEVQTGRPAPGRMTLLQRPDDYVQPEVYGPSTPPLPQVGPYSIGPFKPPPGRMTNLITPESFAAFSGTRPQASGEHGRRRPEPTGLVTLRAPFGKTMKVGRKGKRKKEKPPKPFIEAGGLTLAQQDLEKPGTLSPTQVTELFPYTQGEGEAPPQVTGFRTSQGSTYTWNGNSTQRIKAKRPIHEDFGLKERSEKTVFVDKNAAQEIGMWQTLSATGKRIVLRGNDLILISDNPNVPQGKGSDGIFKWSPLPEIGLHPVELWGFDKKWNTWKENHPGSAITEIFKHPQGSIQPPPSQPQTAPQAQPPIEPAPVQPQGQPAIQEAPLEQPKIGRRGRPRKRQPKEPKPQKPVDPMEELEKRITKSGKKPARVRDVVREAIRSHAIETAEDWWNYTEEMNVMKEPLHREYGALFTEHLAKEEAGKNAEIAAAIAAASKANRPDLAEAAKKVINLDKQEKDLDEEEENLDAELERKTQDAIREHGDLVAKFSTGVPEADARLRRHLKTGQRAQEGPPAQAKGPSAQVRSGEGAAPQAPPTQARPADQGQAWAEPGTAEYFKPPDEQPSLFTPTGTQGGFVKPLVEPPSAPLYTPKKAKTKEEVRQERKELGKKRRAETIQAFNEFKAEMEAEAVKLGYDPKTIHELAKAFIKQDKEHKQPFIDLYDDVMNHLPKNLRDNIKAVKGGLIEGDAGSKKFGKLGLDTSAQEIEGIFNEILPKKDSTGRSLNPDEALLTFLNRDKPKFMTAREAYELALEELYKAPPPAAPNQTRINPEGELEEETSPEKWEVLFGPSRTGLFPVGGQPPRRGPAEINQRMMDRYGLALYGGKNLQGAEAAYHAKVRAIQADPMKFGDFALRAHEVAHHIATVHRLLDRMGTLTPSILQGFDQFDYAPGRADPKETFMEGFSEWFRYRSTGNLANLSPEQELADAWAESWLNVSKEAARANQTRDDILDFLNAGPSRAQTLGSPTGVGVTPESTRDRLADYWRYRFGVLERLMQASRRLGVKLQPGEDPATMLARTHYLAETLAGKMAAKGVITFRLQPNGNRVEEVIFPKPVNWITEGHAPRDLQPQRTLSRRFMGLLPGAKIGMSRLGTFMVGNSVLNETRRGWQMMQSPDPKVAALGRRKFNSAAAWQVAEFQRFIEDIRVNDPAFYAKAMESSRRLTEYFNATLDSLVESGYMTQDKRDAWAAEFPDYVPFSRVIRGQAYKAKIGGAREGSGLEFIDPMFLLHERLRKTAQVLIRQVNDEALIKAGTHEGSTRAGVEGFYLEVDAKEADRTKDVDEALEAQGYDPAQRAAMIAAYGHMAVDLPPRPWRETGRNYYTVMFRGRQRTLEIGNRALYELKTGQQVDEGAIFRILANITDFSKFTATAGKMAWNALNPFRDLWTAAQNMGGEHGYFKAVMLSLAGMGTSFYQKGRRLIGLKYSNLAFQQFIEEGGEKMRALHFAPRGEGARAWEKATGREWGPHGLAIAVANKTKDFFEFIGAAELGPRFAAYRAELLQFGYTNQQVNQSLQANPSRSPIPMNVVVSAMDKAARSTTDFAHIGSFVQKYSKISPFFGAHMAALNQEATNWKRALDEVRQGKWGRYAKGMAGTLGLYLALELLHWWRYKDEDWYKELEPHLRSNWWVLGITQEGRPWGVPKPQGILRSIGTVLQEILRRESGQRPDTAGAAGQLAQQLTPRLTPVVAGEAIDVFRNQSWSGYPIVPARAEHRMEEMQKWLEYRLPYILTQLSGDIASERGHRAPWRAFEAAGSEPNRSIDDVYQRLDYLTIRRNQARAQNQPFPEEREHHQLSLAAREITRLSTMIRGEPGRSQPLTPDRAREARRRQLSIAQSVLR